MLLFMDVKSVTDVCKCMFYGNTCLCLKDISSVFFGYERFLQDFYVLFVVRVLMAQCVKLSLQRHRLSLSLLLPVSADQSET